MVHCKNEKIFQLVIVLAPVLMASTNATRSWPLKTFSASTPAGLQELMIEPATKIG